MKRPIILGIPVDNLNLECAANHVLELINYGKKTKISQYIGTANTQFISNCHHWFSYQALDGELLKSLRNASLITADGMPLVWLSKILQTPLEERVTGVDLVPKILELAEKQSLSVYFFGSDDDTLDQAITAFKDSYENLRIAGFCSPHVNLKDSDRWVDSINEKNPDILFIALGNPKQEIWFKQVQAKLKVPVAIGVGGTFNFISGKVKRAPKWAQDIGLEWLYRILKEPARLGRRYLYCLSKFGYLALSLIIYNALLKFVVRKQGVIEQKANIITLPRVVTGMETFPWAFPCAFDCSKLKYFNPRFLQNLLFFVKSEQVAFYGLRRPVRLLLKLHRVWDEVKGRCFATKEEALAHIFRK